MPRSRPVVAIDGPAGSGKSTTARAVAEALGYSHLDSGALYRAVTLLGVERAGAADQWDPDALVALARSRPVALAPAGPRGSFEVTVSGAPVGDRLRGEAVTREVSRVAAMAPVRAFVNRLLREAARDGGVVLDGRDIGTAVFPDAEVKVFLVAEPAERARRRLLERGRGVDGTSVGAEEAALLERDELDSARALAPLARASDAMLLDTTRLGFDEQVRRLVDLVRDRLASLDRSRARG
jgi:cytidylate kinase